VAYLKINSLASDTSYTIDPAFNGKPELGISEFFTVQGRTSLPLSDWDQSGMAYEDVVHAIEALSLKGFYGPYALVTSPKLFALLSYESYFQGHGNGDPQDKKARCHLHSGDR
jgi:uncharacterized linocin/CFP29 family protein